MPLIVQKYGGSSVATPDRVRAVADRIVAARRAGNDLVVVVSAMGRTTDLLLALAREISPSPGRRELDMLVTCGERASMALLAMATADRGCETLSLTGSQAGIITSTEHGQARIIEVRPVRVHEALDAGKIVIVGGFAGVSTEKEVTTLGRGGSDTTAIALAAALRADRCEILSDVDGVYTADPRIVEDARRIDELSHGEVLELGLQGAKVLAPCAIDYARRHHITLHAKSSFGEGRGTVITTLPHPGRGRAIAVTADEHALPAHFKGDEQRWSTLLRELAAEGLPWKNLRIEDGGGGSRILASVVFDRLNCPGAELLLAPRLDGLRRAGDEVVLRSQNRTASIIGEGIAEQSACWAVAREGLRSLGLAAQEMVGDAYGLRAEVPATALDAIVRRWHEDLLTPRS